MPSSATGVGMPICLLGGVLLILTQKNSQKFGDVLGIMVLDFIQTIRRTPGRHDQLGIANKTRRQPITATLGKLYVVALFISPTHQGHAFLLQALHPVRLTIVSHQNLLNVGLAVEYLSAKLDIRDDTVVSVVLQGSSAQL